MFKKIKKNKNEPIADRHVSVGPVKQFKQQRLIWRFKHSVFLFYGGFHQEALHQALALMVLLVYYVFILRSSLEVSITLFYCLFQ